MPVARAPEDAGDHARGGRRIVRPVALVGVLAAIAIVAATGLVTGPAGPRGDASGPPGASAVASGAHDASPAVPGASAAAPPRTAADGLIAVVDANGALTTMDERGGSVVSHAVPGVAFGFPTWSPDGSRIAAVGTTAVDTSIYVFTVRPGDPGGGTRPVVIYRSPNRPPFYLYWTPDSRHVAFLATESAALSLRLAPADGSAPIDGSAPGAVIRRGAPLYFDWEGADRLLLHVGTGPSAFVGEVGLDGSPAAPAVAGTGDFRAASASHDDRYVAYVRSTTPSTGEIVVAARDGAGQHGTQVFGPVAFVFDPAGDTLAMIGAATPGAASSGFPMGPLRLIDPRTGAARTLVEGFVVAFFWSPDGRTIAALRLARPGDQTAGVFPALTAAERARPVAAATPPPGAEVRLAFIDVGTGEVRSERVVQPAATLVGQVLPYFDQYALSHRFWSPDSASIVLPLVDETGRTKITVVPADGTDSRSLAAGESAFWSP
jgi:TolB protein